MEIFTAEADKGGPGALSGRANLMVVLCGLGEWERAAEQMELFLGASPVFWLVQELLVDLADLSGALPVDATRLRPLQLRLEATAEGLSGGQLGSIGR